MEACGIWHGLYDYLVELRTGKVHRYKSVKALVSDVWV